MAPIFDGVPGFRVNVAAGDADDHNAFDLGLGDEPGPDAVRSNVSQLGAATGDFGAAIAIATPSADGLELPELGDVSPQAIAIATVTVTQVMGR